MPSAFETILNDLEQGIDVWWQQPDTLKNRHRTPKKGSCKLARMETTEFKFAIGFEHQVCVEYYIPVMVTTQTMCLKVKAPLKKNERSMIQATEIIAGGHISPFEEATVFERSDYIYLSLQLQVLGLFAFMAFTVLLINCCKTFFNQ
eukprot:gnl/MRDRNA2_/MRDRNA2_166757_c0_seq1.p1 gnl/MRDRNA2_/MRDRNA2_166757_c0~~gnl/MRDRNA2_/MRDRNA2_166757_c0_seq1.p1  ORF type:complete len:147 (+),score=17.67 gnl/MRDRNA2_/MRDRNA2_166757_c0_seq1:187-627(+)